jgi:MFS family permease
MSASQTARVPRWVAIGLYIAAFVPVGAIGPYIAVYFQSLGLSLDGIGILAALLAACALIAAPIWGAVADQRLGSRSTLALTSLVAAAMGAVVGWTNVLFIAAVFALLFQLAAAGISPVLYAVTLDLVGDNRSRFAFYRVWGSAAFVVSAVLVGILIDATSLPVLFVPAGIGLVVTALFALGIPKRTTSNAARPLSGLREVIRPAAMIAFLLASLIVWSANSMVNDFYSIYLESIGASSALVGSAFALAAIIEIPILLAFPWLAGRFGLRAVLVIGALFFVARTALLLITADPLVASSAMALFGAGSALLLVGGITYVGGLAPSRLAATAQGVFVAVVSGLSQIIGPAAGGLIAGATTLQLMFGVALVASVVGAVAIWMAVASRRVAATPTSAESAVADTGVVDPDVITAA